MPAKTPVNILPVKKEIAFRFARSNLKSTNVVYPNKN